MKESLLISRHVYAAIQGSVGALPPESGGLLGMRGGAVSHFYFDAQGRGSAQRYVPDLPALEHILNRVWLPQGVHFAGMVHSHPSDLTPSYADKTYIAAIYARVLQADAAVTGSFFLAIASCCYADAFAMRCYLLPELCAVPLVVTD